MKITQLFPGTDHEHVLLGEDPAVGYQGIIAIHSTQLGPAVGGTRVWRYETMGEALTDALRLSRGMTYKNAAVGLALGGGKSVIVLNEELADRVPLFEAHGRFVETLQGRYITAEDVGSSPADMAIVRRETRHAVGLEELSGDPSPVTARGVFRAIQAAAATRWGSSDLEGKTVAVQGCGNVGYNLARQLAEAGAKLVVSDIDQLRVARCVEEFKAAPSGLVDIHRAPVDVFAPCALGGVLNEATIPELQCSIVAGAANNQLLNPIDGDRLEARDILYAPDYIANAGGVINGTRELLGWSAERAAAKVEAIYDTVLEVFQLARTEGITAAAAADRIAESRLGDNPTRSVS